MFYCSDCKKCTYCFCSCKCIATCTHYFNGLQTSLNNHFDDNLSKYLTDSTSVLKKCPCTVDIDEVIARS